MNKQIYNTCDLFVVYISIFINSHAYLSALLPFRSREKGSKVQIKINQIVNKHSRFQFFKKIYIK